MRSHNLFGKVRVQRLQNYCEGLRVALIARVKELSEKRYMDCYVSYGDTQKRKGEVITSLEKSEYKDYRTITRIAGSFNSKSERSV